MPREREPLKIVDTESRNAEGQPADSKTYSVYLTLNRSLTRFEREWMYRSDAPRPLGIGGADPAKLPRTMIIGKTTIEQVKAARDEILAFLCRVESGGSTAELEDRNKADQAAAEADAEAKRRQAIADSIDWD